MESVFIRSLLLSCFFTCHNFYLILDCCSVIMRVAVCSLRAIFLNSNRLISPVLYSISDQIFPFQAFYSLASFLGLGVGGISFCIYCYLMLAKNLGKIVRFLNSLFLCPFLWGKWGIYPFVSSLFNSGLCSFDILTIKVLVFCCMCCIWLRNTLS